jgi:phage terminase large subunit GpA-like protein
LPFDTAYPAGLEFLHTSLNAAIVGNMRPPPKLTLSQWAERFAVLSKETSAQTGRFRAFGYQTGILDAITDPAVDTVSVMKGARVGFTKILDHAIGYYIHQDPSPILMVQPRVEDAEDFSKTEIAPMIRDTPVLAALAGDPKAKDSNKTIRKQSFRNGASITYVGANSPGGFRRITVRVVLLDEVDGYPAGGAGDEGDQVKLAKKRSETFWNSKLVLGSTPTIKGVSRIEKSYEAGDCRKFHVACPHCGDRQILQWGGKESAHGIKWAKDTQGNHLPETAYYVCATNGCIIEEADKPDMVAGGFWQASKPFNGHASFHIWAGYSLHVNASWAKLAAEWLEVKNDPLGRQTFINLVLGLPYEDKGLKALNEHSLAARTEVFAAEVPDGVAVVTVGGDVQDDRVELEFIGWGRNEESWSIDHLTIEGDPDEVELWDRVDTALKRTYRRADGRPFGVMAACIDSGGHHTERVYQFAKARLGRKIWAIKGESAQGGKRSPVWPTKKPSARNKKAFRPIILGVNAAKDVIRTRLHIPMPEGHAPSEPIAGFMHFPADRDVNYFAQLVSERSVVKSANGQRYRIWELMSGRANEALDCRVYGYAALCGLMYFGLKLNRWTDAVSEIYMPTPNEVLAPHPREVVEQQMLKPFTAKETEIDARPVIAKKRFKLAGRMAGA